MRLVFVLWVCCGLCACSSDSEPARTLPPPVNDAQAVLVTDGSPWSFDAYELLEVRARNGSDLSDEEIALLGVEAYEKVVLVFEANGGGSETGFDPIPSSFLWKLNSAGNVVFLDQVGNEFESPLGRFGVDVRRQLISFTAEVSRADPDSGVDIVFRGTAFFKGNF